MEDIEKSVRESLKEDMKNSKRKKDKDQSNHSDSKRLKIWLGKRRINESDTDDSDEDGEPGEREDEKSVIIDNGSQSDSSKEAHISSGCRVLENASHDQDSSESCPEEEEIVPKKSLVVSEDKETVDKSTSADLGENIDHSVIIKEVDHLPGESASKLDVAPCAELSSSIQPKVVLDESVSKGVEPLDLDKPLNFDGYHSAAELEVLGMERLKMELQSRGLKCDGTLSERAAADTSRHAPEQAACQEVTCNSLVVT